MTPDAASVSPHGSRQRRFPYMSASTYFPLQHWCWLKSSLHPARCSGSLTVFRAWNQTHAVMIRSNWTPSPSVQHFLTHWAWIYSPWPRSPFGSLAGPGLTQTWPWEPAPPSIPSIQESWGSRAWNCLPLVWSSSSSWQFSSSLASWSPCLHLKVRVHPRPLGRMCGEKMGEEQNGNKLKGPRELWSQFASPESCLDMTEPRVNSWKEFLQPFETYVLVSCFWFFQKRTKELAVKLKK